VKGTLPGVQTWVSGAYDTEVAKTETDATIAGRDQLRHAKDQLALTRTRMYPGRERSVPRGKVIVLDAGKP